MDKRRAVHAAEGKKEAVILEGKIHRKVHTTFTISCLLTGFVGGQANCNDCSIWGHMGRRQTTDCCKFKICTQPSIANMIKKEVCWLLSIALTTDEC